MPEQAQQEPQQQFDVNAFASQVASGVASQLSADAERRAAEAAEMERRRAQATSVAGDPVWNTVAPILAPVAQSLRLDNQLTRDAVMFYNSNEGQEAREFQKDIENIVDQSVKAGHPLDRESAWFYFKGANSAMFQERENKRRIEAARAAATVGASGAPRSYDGTTNPGWTATTPVQEMRDWFAKNPNVKF